MKRDDDMLIYQDYTDKSKSKYICDRCKAELNWDNKIAIHVGIFTKHPKKKWDLCKRCYKALVRGTNK